MWVAFHGLVQIFVAPQNQPGRPLRPITFLQELIYYQILIGMMM